MASFGRNFDFRVPPRAEARGGRFLAPANVLSGSGAGGGTASFSPGGIGGVTLPGGLLPIGCPVVADLTAGQDAYGRQYVKLPAAGTLTTAQGIFGVLVYQYGPAAYAGYDPVLATYADLGFVPAAQPVIVVKGDSATKIVLRTTVAYNFLGSPIAQSGTNYPGRVMVNGLTGGTATITPGDYLVPGSGDDVDGYWESTATAAGAWAVITHVDTTRLEVEAQLLF